MASKVAGVILVAVVVFAGYLGVMQARESKRLSEYKDTKINQVIYINNRKFEPSKPYKIRNEIVFLPLVVVFAGYLSVMQARESKRLSEYKDTKINQVIYINNRKFEPSKPYKIRHEIVFLPLDDVLKALGDKYSYTEKNFGKIELRYKDTVYDLKKGSNVLFNSNTNE